MYMVVIIYSKENVMNLNKKVQDLTQVFDSRWKVNNDYEGRKDFLDKRKEHLRKMYNVPEKISKSKDVRFKVNEIEQKKQNLNQKMNAVNSCERINRINNLKNNFR